ncbi:hypothetical protein C8A01DRAFT_33103 [Parachaetomium inaequale]|uniref:Atos-like conserved domain-containing protein n=1 Tax=Parachaetomium inaequale TaxID=2588326 RepID=A0AAN6PPH3_9PEZI|nr:hypothetical protein C8A01DRAFT_33103 [Parachaetomium inaequale]
MPMFRDDGEMGRRDSRDSGSQYPDAAPMPIQTPPGMGRWFTTRRLSEESIRTDLCEGPLLDSPPRPATPREAVSRAVSDRAELIERLKRGESPTWVPNRHLESLFHQDKGASPPRTPHFSDPASLGLLPAPTITPEKQDAAQGQQSIGSPSREGLNIERPRSALHSGNFTPVELSPGAGGVEDAVLPDSESHFPAARAAWMSTSPPRDYAPFNFTQGAASYRREAFKSGPSSLSSSLSSSFVYQPPTSPLVQSESNEELDLTLPLDSFKIDANSPRNPRRHTLNLAYSPFANSASHRQSPLRRESTYPYQAHQPRRSLNSTPSFFTSGTSPQPPPFIRSRRPSLGSEASTLHHASMVGSYEESILRGRMSTTPSKPLDFTAQIGVLGLGKCKASLRCPAHVTLPFSAVFYNYASTSAGGSKMEDGPSPYVGQIDLENGLPNPEEGQRAKRKLQSRYQDLKGTVEEGSAARDSPTEFSEGEGEGASKATNPRRPSRTPKAPPGGGYRIPEKGQLQIIIKNPNKTAVKLFLIPYDLAGMEPGTKTFIRQRSYSAGPIIEAEVLKDAPTPGSDRPTLRYLIHLHICCPSKGRFYLYKSIRVVFANRVPDGKEKLRNEVTYPDPRFTPYKPIRVMHPPSHAAAGNVITSSIITPRATRAAEAASRRRSAGFYSGQGHPPRYLFHDIHPFGNPEPPPTISQPTPFRQPASSTSWEAQPPPSEQPPFTALTPTTAMSTPTPTRTTMTMPGLEMTGPSTRTPIPTTTPNPNIPPLNPNNPPQQETYDKLTKGDHGYGGGNTNATQNPTGAATTTEGLLSKRLRSLGVQQPHPPAPSQPQPQPQPPPEQGHGIGMGMDETA